MAILLNHALTAEQKSQAQAQLGVGSFAMPPSEVAAIWRQADPRAEIEELGVGDVIAWLARSTKPGDTVLAQGDYGLTFAVVDWALRTGRAPVYATTERCATERSTPQGTEVTRRFVHVRFRKYARTEETANGGNEHE